MKKPELEMSVLYNTQHPARKAPPPPGIVVSKKKLSQAQSKRILAQFLLACPTWTSQMGDEKRKGSYPHATSALIL
jgi:hypothetical protein